MPAMFKKIPCIDPIRVCGGGVVVVVMVEGHGIAGWLADDSVPDRRAKRAAKSKGAWR